jgi:hypothetical protein
MAHKEVAAALVADLLDLRIQECHPNDAFYFLIRSSNVVSEHSPRTEAVEYDWSLVVLEFKVDEVIADVDPIIVRHRGPFCNFCHSIICMSMTTASKLALRRGIRVLDRTRIP